MNELKRACEFKQFQENIVLWASHNFSPEVNSNMCKDSN